MVAGFVCVLLLGFLLQATNRTSTKCVSVCGGQKGGARAEEDGADAGALQMRGGADARAVDVQGTRISSTQTRGV